MGVALDYVIPPQTILIENPVAVTKESRYPKQANAFLQFRTSPAAQRIFGQNGFRPVRKDVYKTFRWGKVRKLFTICNLGSWPKVQDEFFDPQHGIVTRIERDKGAPP